MSELFPEFEEAKPGPLVSKPKEKVRATGDYQVIRIHFATQEARRLFAEAIGQPLNDDIKYVWHPKPDPKTLKGLPEVLLEDDPDDNEPF